jgi:hypothetical protein
MALLSDKSKEQKSNRFRFRLQFFRGGNFSFLHFYLRQMKPTRSIPGRHKSNYVAVFSFQTNAETLPVRGSSL